MMANEKRLIDANALMDVIKQHEYCLATRCGSVDYGMFTTGIQQAVDEQPTINAVPVVRCEKCVAHGNCLAERVFVCAGIENPYCCAGEQKEGAD